jgi:hypothetical protein
MRKKLSILGATILVMGIGSSIFWFHARAEVPSLAGGNPHEPLRTKSPTLHLVCKIVGIDIEAPSNDASADAELFCARIWHWCLASLGITTCGAVLLVISLRRKKDGSQQSHGEPTSKSAPEGASSEASHA